MSLNPLMGNLDSYAAQQNQYAAQQYAFGLVGGWGLGSGVQTYYPPVVPPVTPPVPVKKSCGFLSDLRDEIDGWHGNCLRDSGEISRG